MALDIRKYTTSKKNNMAARRPPGSPGRIISFFRDTLLGRPAMEHPWSRKPATQSTRSPDPANLPKGPAHILAFNYYLSRDLRRDSQPPTIASSYKPLLRQPTEGDEETSEVSKQTVSTVPPVPGSGHQWNRID